MPKRPRRKRHFHFTVPPRTRVVGFDGFPLKRETLAEDEPADRRRKAERRDKR